MRRLFILTITVLFSAGLPGQQMASAPQIAGKLAQQYFQQNGGAPGGNGGGNPVPEAMQSRFFTGTNGDQLGQSAASAGDVNGDGYDDVIIGAPFNDAGGADAGRAYVYYGGNIFNTVADVILTGAAEGDLFGMSVASAGDVNGDGFGDVIVGAQNNGAGGSRAGRAYIYFGGTTMNNAADVVLTGAAANDWFGISVASAGDVNGDGYSDVIVGAYGSDAGGSESGSAYIYFGGASMNSASDVTLPGAAAGDSFGLIVASAADVNGDGYSDVIAGAPYNDAGGTDAGRAYVYYGGAAMDGTADITLTGAAAGDNFGASLAAAGDVNGDGYLDIIAGAPNNDAGAINAGRAYLYYGGAAMDNIADVTMTGAAVDDLFGSSVSTAGDVNGDGYSDVIVGASANDAGGINSGRAYIYFGDANAENIADATMSGVAAGDFFGTSVASAGDVNSDGYSDVLVGAPYNDAGGNSSGRAYIYLNSMTGTDIADEIFTGLAANERFGWSVASAGDVNGDGFDDIIVGTDKLSSSVVYLYFGGPSMDNIADVILSGTQSDEGFGKAVASAGDVNGDGYSDVIVGARLNNAAGILSGRAYIYFGGGAMDNVFDIAMVGEAAGDNFGYSVSGAGDVNGDGYSDVIIGAINNDLLGTDAGRAYIFYGGTVMDGIPDIAMGGDAPNDNFGTSVACAGDVNGDGYSDVLVGARYNAAGGTSAGRAYLFFGGAQMDFSADVKMTGAAAEDSFGWSVASAGDVNKDGYSDVIVGAFGSDAGGTDAGRAYIYFGSTAMDNIADVTLTGAAPNDQFGVSVASAEDVNGDGYCDVIVGAWGSDAGGSNAGRAYIFFGGATMDNTADVTMTGEGPDNGFGFSATSAGDVNGDGYGDVIVGADGNNSGGNNAGRAYLYLSSSPSVKPRIMAAKDVPGDQGGKVSVDFIRSGYDAAGISKITTYTILRSKPPVNGQFYWENIGSVSPLKLPAYSFIASTPYDSITNLSGTFYFRVVAQTANSNDFWFSNIISGHSVDNLAPAAVKNFGVGVSGASNRLSWKLNTEADLKDYVIFRSSTPTIDPATAPVYATAADSFYLDTAPLSTESYYFIAARDVHRNLSTPSSSPAPSAGVNLTAYLEGFYDDVLNEQRADTVRVYLRNVSAPYAVIDSSIGLLGSNGTGTFKFFAAPSGSYYIVLKHRNSIQTWSKAGGEALTKGSSLNYNFSSASSQAYAYNMRLKNGRWCLFGGDVNQDDIVDYTDMSMIDNDSYNFVSGYVPADLTGDDFVDYSDLSLADNNSYNYVAAVYPGSMKKTPAAAGALRTQYLPKRYGISEGYPNPFNPATRLNYSLPKEGKVSIVVYNTLGETIKTLVDEAMPAGYHSVYLNMPSSASGTYLVCFAADNYVQTKKIVLMK